jgi:hypothetical protein
MITTVRTIDGKVWHVNPPTYVILTLPDGTNKEYKVPKGQIFNVNGAKDTIFELRKGMTVSATVVKEEPVVEVAEHKGVTGVTPKPKAQPQIPDSVDTLLVESSHQPAQPTQTTQTASAEPAQRRTPRPEAVAAGWTASQPGAGMLARRIRWREVTHLARSTAKEGRQRWRLSSKQRW